jgi:hypothetical protein
MDPRHARDPVGVEKRAHALLGERGVIAVNAPRTGSSEPNPRLCA